MTSVMPPGRRSRAFRRYMCTGWHQGSGNLRGTSRGSDGKPLVNLGRWGIQFGNGRIGTPNSLVFAAGIGITTPNGLSCREAEKNLCRPCEMTEPNCGANR